MTRKRPPEDDEEATSLYDAQPGSRKVPVARTRTPTRRGHESTRVTGTKTIPDGSEPGTQTLPDAESTGAFPEDQLTTAEPLRDARPTLRSSGPVDDGTFTDDVLPTTIDPHVPTGGTARPAAFDPLARIDDNRRTKESLPQRKPAPGSPDVELPKTIRDQPTGSRRVPGPTPLKRIEDPRMTMPASPGARAATPRPAAPAPPAPVPARTPARFDPHGRIDDSSRTAKWVPADVATATDVDTVPNPMPEPMRVISMKTPMDLEAEKQARVLPGVKLRPLSDLAKTQTPPHGMGNLAPPHDPADARSRKLQEFVIWGSVIVITASLVTLAIWFLAR